MAINQVFEDFTRFELLAPSGVAINTGDVLIFGTGTRAMVGIAQTAQSANNATGPWPMMTTPVSSRCRSLARPQWLSVTGQTRKKFSCAGAAIKRGDAVYADAGTFDLTSGITYGLPGPDADTTGTFHRDRDGPGSRGCHHEHSRDSQERIGELRHDFTF